MNTSSSGTRTQELITPLAAMTMNATVAIPENRRAAISVWVPSRSACASTAKSPPTQIAAEIKCRIRLLVATSCDPPEEECPVKASGIMVAIAAPNSTGVQPQRSARRQPTATTNAKITVVRQAPASAT